MSNTCCPTVVVDNFCAIKDPDEVLDYTINWSDVLDASNPVDSIVTSTWAVDEFSNGADLNIDSETETNPYTTVWLSGGGRLNSIHKVVNHITTAGGRQYERTIKIWIQNKGGLGGYGGMTVGIPGVDGIDVNPDGTYLYYAAMSHQKLYRIPVNILTDFDKPETIIETRIEELWDRPLCDGIRVDENNIVYLTDFENHQILALDDKGNEEVILHNENIRWADGLSFGADGYLYITDSALQHVIMKSKKKFKEHAPFGLWRVKL
jgi:hypothetical protein